MPRINLTQAAVERLLPHPAKRQIDYWDTNLPRFGLRVYPTGIKHWVVNYVVDGRQRMPMLASVARVPDIRVARLLAFATLARARRGIDKPVIDHHLAARQTARLAPAGERLKYHNQKSRAKVRGIKWKLTLEEWLAWWQATGCYHKRGRRKGQYQMARRGDAGA